MDAKTINSIEMTRRIRDQHYQILAGKTRIDQIRFFRKKAQEMEEMVSNLLQSNSKIPIIQEDI